MSETERTGPTGSEPSELETQEFVDQLGIEASGDQWVTDIMIFHQSHRQAMELFAKALANPSKENVEKFEEAIKLVKKNADLIAGKDFYWDEDIETEGDKTQPLRAAVTTIGHFIEEMDAKLIELVEMRIPRDPYSSEVIDKIVDSVTEPPDPSEVFKKPMGVVARHSHVCGELIETLKSHQASKQKGVKQVFTPQNRTQWEKRAIGVGITLGAAAIVTLVGDHFLRRMNERVDS